MYNAAGDAEAAGINPPFLYEIKVKGRLSPEQWTSWFDHLSVSFNKGESLLRGQAPDHAALYGLLARLRDLAVPLVSVKVLDAEAQRRLATQRARGDLLINVLLVAVYLALLGALVTVAVFAARVVNAALALAVLFAVLAGLAHAFWLWSGQRAWLWLGYVAWPAAIICLTVFIPNSSLLPPPLGIGLLLLLIAGALLYAISFLRRRRADIEALLPGRRPAATAPLDGAGVTDRSLTVNGAESGELEDQTFTSGSLE